MKAKFIGIKGQLQCMPYVKGDIRLHKGEFFIINNSRGGILFLGCPQCGELHFGDTQILMGDKNMVSVMAPIKMRCCNWEGFLLLNELIVKDDNNKHGVISGDSQILSEEQKVS